MTKKRRTERLRTFEAKIPPIVQVLWLDASAKYEEHYVPDEDNCGMVMSTVGHLIHEDADFVYLSIDIDELGHARDGMEIPRVNILAIRRAANARRKKQ